MGDNAVTQLADGISTEERQSWFKKEYEKLSEIDPADGLTFANKTSMMVAYERSLESSKPQDERLFNDFLASHLAGKYGKNVSEVMGVGLQPMFDPKMEWFRYEGHVHYVAARTKLIGDWLEKYLVWHMNEDFKQIINLGCGLDTRVYWDDCLRKCTLYLEVDTLEVNKFKKSVLDRLEFDGFLPNPMCNREVVSMDFSKETISDLPRKESSFDQTKPSCWILEGLVMYLTKDDNIQLLTSISNLAVSGSLLILNFAKNASNCDPNDHNKLLVKNGWVMKKRVMFGDSEFNYGKYPSDLMDPNPFFGFSFYEKD